MELIKYYNNKIENLKSVKKEKVKKLKNLLIKKQNKEKQIFSQKMSDIKNNDEN